jgi:nitrate reductase NapAB chaperone NapD
MPVSSMIVKAQEDRVDGVVVAIRALRGATVHAVQGSEIVAVTDTATEQEDHALWQAMEQTEGVAKLDLIYHNFEDVDDFEGKKELGR